MATKPELNIAEYGKDISSVQYNENFDKLNDYIEAVSEELMLKVNTINSQLSSNVLSNLQSIYPVGSLYIGTTDNCPIANLFGTWEKIGDGFITSVNSNVPIRGTGKALGLRNGINGQLLTLKSYTDGAEIDIYGGGATLPTQVNGFNRPNTGYIMGVSKNANESGIVGTASATKLAVNIWKRTA